MSSWVNSCTSHHRWRTGTSIPLTSFWQRRSCYSNHGLIRMMMMMDRMMKGRTPEERGCGAGRRSSSSCHWSVWLSSMERSFSEIVSSSSPSSLTRSSDQRRPTNSSSLWPSQTSFSESLSSHSPAPTRYYTDHLKAHRQALYKNKPIYIRIINWFM